MKIDNYKKAKELIEKREVLEETLKALDESRQSITLTKKRLEHIKQSLKSVITAEIEVINTAFNKL